MPCRLPECIGLEVLFRVLQTEEWSVHCCCQNSLAQSFDRRCTYLLPSSNSGIILLTQLILIVTLLHMCEIYIKKDCYLFRWHINVTGTNWIYLQLTTAIYMQNFKTIFMSVFIYTCIFIKYLHVFLYFFTVVKSGESMFITCLEIINKTDV